MIICTIETNQDKDQSMIARVSFKRALTSENENRWNVQDIN